MKSDAAKEWEGEMKQGSPPFPLTIRVVEGIRNVITVDPFLKITSRRKCSGIWILSLPSAYIDASWIYFYALKLRALRRAPHTAYPQLLIVFMLTSPYFRRLARVLSLLHSSNFTSEVKCG